MHVLLKCWVMDFEGKKRFQRDIGFPWRHHIGTFWIIAPISHSKRVEVALLGWLLNTMDLVGKY